MEASALRTLSSSNNVAGVKRPAPALLPAIDFVSSPPPVFKRQKSRVSPTEEENQYPTPEPSSTLGAVPSSPPPPSLLATTRPRRPTLQRTTSERAPLAIVPSITLPENGDEILLGRSSNRCHYVFPTHMSISRVHAKARYQSVSVSATPKILIECIGANGMKVDCHGASDKLEPGDVFSSLDEHDEIILEIQETRVIINWPGEPAAATRRLPRVGRGSWAPLMLEEEGGNDENSVEKALEMQVPPRGGRRVVMDSSSPLQRVSAGTSREALTSEAAEPFLDIFEDEPVQDFEETQVQQEASEDEEQDLEELTAPVEGYRKTSLGGGGVDAEDEIEGGSSPLSSAEEDELVDPFTSTKPDSLPATKLFSTQKPKPSTPSPRPAARPASALQNHLSNQLAYSRVAALALSELFGNLPPELSSTLSLTDLRGVLTGIKCVGEVKRTGKDAAGRPLESQFYYVPEMDDDRARKATLGGRAGLRQCRKSHKQYYWKKPKA